MGDGIVTNTRGRFTVTSYWGNFFELSDDDGVVLTGNRKDIIEIMTLFLESMQDPADD